MTYNINLTRNFYKQELHFWKDRLFHYMTLLQFFASYSEKIAIQKDKKDYLWSVHDLIICLL